MAQTIKLKRSATSGAIPTTSSLALGEVAINTYDGKMYIKKDVGGTETIVQVGAGSDSVSYLEAGMIEYEYTATSNQTSFSGSDDNSATLSYVAESIMVFVNGVLQDDGVDYTASNGTSVVFGTGLAAADEVRIVAFTNVTTAASLQDPTKLDAISTVNNQAAYSLTLDSSAYTPSSQNALIVSLNGITQEPGDSFTISGSTITFSPALVTGDVIDYIIDMGRAVTIGEYSGDLAVGGNLTVGGELEVTGDIIGDLRGSTLFKAQAGEALSKGSVVYISGISGNTTIVSKADSNDSAKMPAFGIAAEAAGVNNPVDVYTFGLLKGVDTSAYSEGDELFVSNTAGELISTPPTGEASKLQKIAKVTRSHASAGSIFIMGAGRSNAVPNLDDGDIFIGNSSNQAVSAALDTSIVPENGNLYFTTARVDSHLSGGTGVTYNAGEISIGQDVSTTATPTFGNITTTGYIAGPATFTIDPAAVGDNTGTLVVAGNLQVDGNTTTINSTTMTVDDLNITLASGAANAAAANGAGITVDGASATLTYNGTNDDWNFNKGLNVTSGDLHVSELGSQITMGPTLNASVHTGMGIKASTPRLTFEPTGDVQSSRIQFANTSGTQWGSIFAYNDTEHMQFSASTFNFNGGNVGINQSNPAEKLDVSGNVKLTGQFFQSMPSDFWSQGTTFIEINGMGNLTHQGSYETCLTSNGYRDNNNQWKSYAINNFTGAAQIKLNPQGHISFHTDSNKADGSSSSLAERVRIDSSGNVGIRTTTPSRNLTIGGGAAATTHLQLTNATTGTTTSDGFQISQYTSGAVQLWNKEDSYTAFGTNNIERMRISDSGTVGIGQDNPDLGYTGKLVVSEGVVGGYSYIDISNDNDNQFLKVGINSNNGVIAVDNNDVLTFGHLPNAGSNTLTERMRIDTSGNVGIGTSLPVSQLHLKSDDPLIRFEDDQGGAARVYECGSAQGQFTINNVTQSTQPFAINDSGLVRIGPSSAAPAPSAMLHIHKNVNAGAVAFGDEASQVISSNTNAAGVQGYIGSMFFGAQDVSSATQYAWKAAGIAGYMAGDLGTGGATADLLFYTANASQTPTEKMRITSAGNVGIGTAPTDKLHLAGTAPQIVKLECTDTSLVSDQVVGALQWRTNDPSGSGVGDCAQIAVRSASTVGGSFIMQFNVASTTALNQEAMRLDRDGNLIIGGIISSPAAKLVVFSTGNGSLTYNTGHTGIHINNENATAGNGNFGGGISFSRLGATGDDQSAAIVPVQTTTDQDHMGLAFFIHHTNTRANPLKEAARIDEDGLKFNGDTAAANALDDYEEGTWTPTTPNGSWTVNEATYTKIGRLVYVRARVSAVSAVSGDFGGLPFQVTGGYTAGSVGYQNSVSGEVFSLLVQSPANYNFRIGNGQYGLAAGKQAMFSATYETT